MGNKAVKAKVDDDIPIDHSHLTRNEIQQLKTQFEKKSKNHESITKQEFMELIKNHVQYWSAGTIFLERLFDAFDVNGDKTIDCEEFLKGMNIFIRGTPEEKLELSFKMYDLNRDGNVSQKEIVRFLTQMYSTFYQEDQTAQIKEMSRRLFDDLDIDGNGELSLEEYKLSALKEPMIVNFLEQFLIEPSQNTSNSD